VFPYPGVTPLVDGDRASATSAKWLSRASFCQGRQITMHGDNVNDGLEAEERDGGGMEAPSCFSSHSCSSINLINLMVSFLLLDGMAMLRSERELRVFVTRGSSSCSSCA